MGEAYLDWQSKSDGIKLNDVIEEYRYVAAGKKIKAGDLVNYINGVAGKVDYGESVDTQLSTVAQTGYAISAVQLDENRVFIAHSYGSNYHLYGVVVTVNGANITYGTDTMLSNSANSGYAISAVALDKNKVFIAHSSGTSYMLYTIVCNIDGNTIICGSDVLEDNYENAGKVISAIKIADSKVFLAHSRRSDYYLYGKVCTISNTTVTSGALLAIGGYTYAGYTISTCLLPNGNVFIAHSNSSNYRLYGIVVSISGTTITAGTDTALVGAEQSGFAISTLLLENGNVFIAHSRYVSYNYDLYGMVVSIDGTTITSNLANDTLLSQSEYVSNTISAVRLEDNRVFISHSYKANDCFLYGMVVTIDGTTIAKSTDTELVNVQHSGSAISTLLLENGNVFIAHSHTYNTKYLYAQIFGIDYKNNVPTNNIVIPEYETQVTPATEPPFNAIALSSGEGGTDTEHNQQVKIARVANKLSMLPVGALVKDVNSTFLGQPVIWKIADKNHAGYPDGSVTLITERSIALRAFDAKEPNNSNSDRKSYGNNRYSVSNICQWLNSDAGAGQWYSAQHSADQKPDTSSVTQINDVAMNPYDTDAGFLNGFSSQFKGALLETTLTVVLNTAIDGGGSEIVTNKIFLASNTEVGLTNENSIAEGSLLPIFSDNASRISYCTESSVRDNDNSTPANNTTAWYWWLRTPVIDHSAKTRYVNNAGNLAWGYAYGGTMGVRPLCNIPSSIRVSEEPDADGCYTLFAGGEA